MPNCGIPNCGTHFLPSWAVKKTKAKLPCLIAGARLMHHNTGGDSVAECGWWLRGCLGDEDDFGVE
jgi:hypothetical protein